MAKTATAGTAVSGAPKNARMLTVDGQAHLITTEAQNTLDKLTAEWRKYTAAEQGFLVNTRKMAQVLGTLFTSVCQMLGVKPNGRGVVPAFLEIIAGEDGYVAKDEAKSPVSRSIRNRWNRMMSLYNGHKAHEALKQLQELDGDERAELVEDLKSSDAQKELRKAIADLKDADLTDDLIGIRAELGLGKPERSTEGEPAATMTTMRNEAIHALLEAVDADEHAELLDRLRVRWHLNDAQNKRLLKESREASTFVTFGTRAESPKYVTPKPKTAKQTAAETAAAAKMADKLQKTLARSARKTA